MGHIYVSDTSFEFISDIISDNVTHFLDQKFYRRVYNIFGRFIIQFTERSKLIERLLIVLRK